MSGMANTAEARQAAGVSAAESVARAAAAGQAALDESQAKAVLADLGITVPRGRRLAPGEAPDLAGLTPPLALKGLSDQALHKSDIGAVMLGLEDGEQVARARDGIAARMAAAGVPLTGFLLEEMAATGVEVVIGGMRDPQLGAMIMIGAGGIHAEILGDVAFRLCPIDAAEARAMIADLKIAPILSGARGAEPVNTAALEAALLALGGPEGLFTTRADVIAEFDINPLFARPDGLVAVDCRIVFDDGTAGAAPGDAPDAGDRGGDVVERFRPLFEPRSIAVVGASARGGGAGNRFIRQLSETGYRGQIFPIHPTAASIEGHDAFADLASVPGSVDYAYLTLPAERVGEVLAKAGGRLGFAQVMASAEGEGQAEWEAGLAEAAREGGFRVIGPNCMGTHSPRGRFSFMENAIIEPGPVGIGCQSGGLGMDILRRGQNIGLRFSGLVTLGNSVDVTPTDLLEYYLADDQTRVVGLYVESVRDGKRFAELLRRNRGGKPVVLLVGGMTGQGGAAAASHTGAMGGSEQAWRALARQSGAILTDTLDAFLDMLQLCQLLTPRRDGPAPGVTLFGNGGGASVLATDALDRAGLHLAAPSANARAAYDRITLPPGASLANPIDLPASVLKEEEGRVTGRILDIDARMTRPWATLVHLNLPVIMTYRHMPDFLPNLMDAVFGPADAAQDDPAHHTVLVVRSDRSEEADAWKRNFRAVAATRGVPTFDEIPQAVNALAAFHRYELFLCTSGSTGAG